MKYSSEDVERFERYKRIHLRNDEMEQPLDQQLESLQKRKRNKWMQMAVNVLAILFFGYSYYFDITQLGNTFLYILIAVFVVNTALIFYQRKQILELEQFMNHRLNKDEPAS